MQRAVLEQSILGDLGINDDQKAHLETLANTLRGVTAKRLPWNAELEAYQKMILILGPRPTEGAQLICNLWGEQLAIVHPNAVSHSHIAAFVATAARAHLPYTRKNKITAATPSA